MLQIIRNAQKHLYQKEYAAFLSKHFGDPAWPYDLNNFVEMYKDEFYLATIGMEEGKILSFIDMTICSQAGLQGLIDGKLREQDVIFYPKGGSEGGCLFLMALVFENRQHGPYLFKKAFTDLAEILKKWKVNLTHVYTIAYSKISERLMRHQKFEVVGMYEGKYPIMAIKVVDHPYLAAFIPSVETQTRAPWEKE